MEMGADNKEETFAEAFVEHMSGARSSGIMPRYDLIPHYALARLANRYREGAEKYGEWNWQRGLDDQAFLTDRLNHIFEHLHKYAQRMFANRIYQYKIDQPYDDDLAAAAWGLFTLMEAERHGTGTVGSQSGDSPLATDTRTTEPGPGTCGPYSGTGSAGGPAGGARTTGHPGAGPRDPIAGYR